MGRLATVRHQDGPTGAVGDWRLPVDPRQWLIVPATIVSVRPIFSATTGSGSLPGSCRSASVHSVHLVTLSPCHRNWAAGAEPQAGVGSLLVGRAETLQHDRGDFPKPLGEAVGVGGGEDGLGLPELFGQAALPGKIGGGGRGQVAAPVRLTNPALGSGKLVQVVQDDPVEGPGHRGGVAEQRQVEPAAAEVALPAVPGVAGILQAGR